MWALVVVDVASHVISQQSLQSKFLSAIGALKVLLLGHMLPLAVVKELDSVSEEPTTSWAANQSLLGVTPEVFLQLADTPVCLSAPLPGTPHLRASHLRAMVEVKILTTLTKRKRRQSRCSNSEKQQIHDYDDKHIVANTTDLLAMPRDMGIVVEGVVPDGGGSLLAALPLACEGLREVGQNVPLAGVEHAGLQPVARQHVQPVALDLGVVAVEVDVPNHLGRVDALEATLGPEAAEHVL